MCTIFQNQYLYFSQALCIHNIFLNNNLSKSNDMKCGTSFVMKLTRLATIIHNNYHVFGGVGQGDSRNVCGMIRCELSKALAKEQRITVGDKN